MKKAFCDLYCGLKMNCSVANLEAKLTDVKSVLCLFFCVGGSSDGDPDGGETSR